MTYKLIENGVTTEYSNRYFRNLLLNRSGDVEFKAYEDSDIFYTKGFLTFPTYDYSVLFSTVSYKINESNMKQLRMLSQFNRNHFRTILHLIFSGHMGDRELTEYINNTGLANRRGYLISLLTDDKETLNLFNGFRRSITSRPQSTSETEAIDFLTDITYPTYDSETSVSEEKTIPFIDSVLNSDVETKSYETYTYETVSNPDKSWYQFWKDKTVTNKITTINYYDVVTARQMKLDKRDLAFSYINKTAPFYANKRFNFNNATKNGITRDMSTELTTDWFLQQASDPDNSNVTLNDYHASVYSTATTNSVTSGGFTFNKALLLNLMDQTTLTSPYGITSTSFTDNTNTYQVRSNPNTDIENYITKFQREGEDYLSTFSKELDKSQSFVYKQTITTVFSNTYASILSMFINLINSTILSTLFSSIVSTLVSYLDTGNNADLTTHTPIQQLITSTTKLVFTPEERDEYGTITTPSTSTAISQGQHLVDTTDNLSDNYHPYSEYFQATSLGDTSTFSKELVEEYGSGIDYKITLENMGGLVRVGDSIESSYGETGTGTGTGTTGTATGTDGGVSGDTGDGESLNSSGIVTGETGEKREFESFLGLYSAHIRVNITDFASRIISDLSSTLSQSKLFANPSNYPYITHAHTDLYLKLSSLPFTFKRDVTFNKVTTDTTKELFTGIVNDARYYVTRNVKSSTVELDGIDGSEWDSIDWLNRELTLEEYKGIKYVVKNDKGVRLTSVSSDVNRVLDTMSGLFDSIGFSFDYDLVDYSCRRADVLFEIISATKEICVYDESRGLVGNIEVFFSCYLFLRWLCFVFDGEVTELFDSSFMGIPLTDTVVFRLNKLLFLVRESIGSWLALWGGMTGVGGTDATVSSTDGSVNLSALGELIDSMC